MEKMSRKLSITGLTLALFAPLLFGVFLGRGNLSDPTHVIAALSIEWVIALFVILVVIYGERASLKSLDFRTLSIGDFVWTLGAVFVGGLAFPLTTPLVKALGLNSTNDFIPSLAQTPVFLRIGIVITAGITEEIIFRGYAIKRLESLIGKKYIAAVISGLFFTLMHVPFLGWGGAFQVGIWSIAVTILFLRRRNLTASILMHILNDAPAFIIMPMYPALLPH